MRALLSQLRPMHWTKNIVVFAGVFFSGVYSLLPLASLIFLAFCATASAVYIINDLYDLAADRKHPTKRNRPLAKGSITKAQALALLIACLVIAVALSLFIPPVAATILGIYFVLQVTYTMWLKHVPVLDIFVIGSGFMLRGFAGTDGLSLPSSPWFITTIITLSLFLVFGKRLHEKRLPAHSQRNSLQFYSLEFLSQAMYACMILTLCFYALYVIETKNTLINLLTIIVVLFGFLRYMYLVDRKNVSGDPVLDFFKDKTLLGTTIIWVVVFYFGNHI